MLLLWPGEVRRKREDDLGRIGPALFAGTNISDQSIKEISSTSYLQYDEMGIKIVNDLMFMNSIFR